MSENNPCLATLLFLIIHDILYAHILYVLHKKLLRVALKSCISKKIFHIEVTLCQNYVSHKKYVVGTEKIISHPKVRLNMFSVAQGRNTCWQKIVSVVYKYMLHWLKKFSVAQKIVWCRSKIKVGVHKCF